MPQICCKALFCWTYYSEVQHKHSTALFDNVGSSKIVTSTQVTSKACW